MNCLEEPSGEPCAEIDQKDQAVRIGPQREVRQPSRSEICGRCTLRFTRGGGTTAFREAAPSIRGISMQIRPARREDARRIAKIHLASWQTAFRDLMPDDCLNKQSIDDRQAGWIHLRVSGRLLAGQVMNITPP